MTDIKLNPGKKKKTRVFSEPIVRIDLQRDACGSAMMCRAEGLCDPVPQLSAV